VHNARWLAARRDRLRPGWHAMGVDFQPRGVVPSGTGRAAVRPVPSAFVFLTAVRGAADVPDASLRPSRSCLSSARRRAVAATLGASLFLILRSWSLNGGLFRLRRRRRLRHRPAAGCSCVAGLSRRRASLGLCRARGGPAYTLMAIW
jgi:hypothetical protein